MIVHLAQASLALFLLISGFHIHWARVARWSEFSAAFGRIASERFGQVTQPRWQYVVAAPFVAALLTGLGGLMLQEDWARWPWAVGSAGVLLMDLIGRQTAIWRGAVVDLLVKAGFAVGGALALLLFLPID